MEREKKQDEFYAEIKFALLRLKCDEISTRVEVRDCQQTLEQVKITLDFAHYGKHYGSAKHYWEGSYRENKRLLALKAQQILSINVKELEE